MIDIRSIKLIIWDLDDTFWKGTLSEEEPRIIEDNVQLIKDLTDCGIINSICSKNELEPAKKRLLELGVWDLFVFPSINWESKGPQLKDKLDKMALRPVNVLFLDDNPSNLGEARHFLPDIQVAGPETVEDLIRQVRLLEKKDLQHKRLKQYRILEEKDTASKNFSSSEDFLYSSQIQVEIKHDCIEQIQRIHELLLRSNQLNYTKKRIGIEELETIMKDKERDCGYVTVKDRFGDYGIVGFFAMKGNELEHFFFSCRTMGQKIEQWVYAQLGFPHLEVVGEVRTQLNTVECPGWINCSETYAGNSAYTEAHEVKCKALFKGPCDLSHSLVYIKGSDRFDTELSYVCDADGRIIDTHNHSVHIEGLYTYSEREKQEIANDCVFIDPAMLDGCFFKKEYDVIFLSTLLESVYQIYKKKGSNLRVVFGGMDLTDPANWDDYINKRIYVGGNSFTRGFLESFSRKYECLGLTTPDMYIKFLQKCLNWLPEKTYLCLILGTTKFHDREDLVQQRHRELNDAIKSFSTKHPRIKYIEIDNCIHDSSDFTGGINHFSSRVYYEIAQEIIGVIQAVTGKKIDSFSSKMVFFDSLILKVRRYLKRKLKIKQDSVSYRFSKRVYDRIYKHRT